jgi:excinuclease ABC subunit C
VDPEDYRRRVDALLLFLAGRDQELTERLRAEMEQAAATRRYERAAERRDQLELLERARVPQKVVRFGGRDTDVVGLARAHPRAAIAVLVQRGGRVVGKESRILDHAAEPDEAELLESALSQHYLPRQELPRRIVVGALPAGADVLAGALAQRGGHPVELAAPTRGREHRLVAAAERNAAHALEDLAARAAGRRARHAPEMLELQRLLHLAAPPFRMICFDVSNLGAEGAVAAIVASEGGRPRRGLYRRMRIRRPGPDDFAMIAEAVTRYWTRVESGELPRPELVVVDGGVGQVRAARLALDHSSTRPVALVGLAKREETVIRENAPPLRLPRRSAALQMLQRVRDEAHRFGLDYHRRLRQRARIGSALDAVPGVGPTRRAALLKAFGSIEAIREAPAERVASLAGVPLTVAERVREYLAGAESTPSDSGPPDPHEGGERRGVA